MYCDSVLCSWFLKDYYFKNFGFGSLFLFFSSFFQSLLFFPVYSCSHLVTMIVSNFRMYRCDYPMLPRRNRMYWYYYPMLPRYIWNALHKSFSIYFCFFWCAIAYVALHSSIQFVYCIKFVVHFTEKERQILVLLCFPSSLR